MPPSAPGAGGVGDGDPANGHSSGARGQGAGHDGQQRGLSRAVGAQESEYSTGINSEIEWGQDFNESEIPRYFIQRNNGGRPSAPVVMECCRPRICIGLRGVLSVVIHVLIRFRAGILRNR